MPSSQITESNCTPCIPGEQILSYHTSAQITLHWLPVKYRIVFKIISITFKAIHGLAPALETPEEMISIPMTAYSLLLAGVKHSPRSAIDLSTPPPLNYGTIFRALSETPNL